jgi:hypothetical protein
MPATQLAGAIRRKPIRRLNVYSREYLGFLPLTLLPIVLGTIFIALALLWGHSPRPL